jgi:Ni,Fe-hydrogenase I cytochrome b subunit
MKGYYAPFPFFIVFVSSRFTTFFLYVRKVLLLLAGIIFVAFLVIRYFFIFEIKRSMRSRASVMFLVDVA